MNRGWIKLYRKISDNELWTSEPFTRGQAWIDLLLLANHKDSYIFKRGNRIDIIRGQVGWSQLKLGERWKWSRPKVKKFLIHLENEGFLLQQNSNLTSLITIINYNEYQDIVTTDDTTDLTTEKQQTLPQKSNRPYPNKNDKNIKNDKEEEKPFLFKDVFELIWEQYPMKSGKKEALRHYQATIKSQTDADSCQQALTSYLKHLSLEQNSFKQPMNGKTWFNNWNDWVDWVEPLPPEDQAKQREQQAEQVKELEKVIDTAHKDLADAKWYEPEHPDYKEQQGKIPRIQAFIERKGAELSALQGSGA